MSSVSSSRIARDSAPKACVVLLFVAACSTGGESGPSPLAENASVNESASSSGGSPTGGGTTGSTSSGRGGLGYHDGKRLRKHVAATTATWRWRVGGKWVGRRRGGRRREQRRSGERPRAARSRTPVSAFEQRVRGQPSSGGVAASSGSGSSGAGGTGPAGDPTYVFSTFRDRREASHLYVPRRAELQALVG